MLTIGLEPVQIDPIQASTPQAAFTALAAEAQHYLREFDLLASSAQVPPGGAVITRVRGTGPGVSFGALLEALLGHIVLKWEFRYNASGHIKPVPWSGPKNGPFVGASDHLPLLATFEIM